MTPRPTLRLPRRVVSSKSFAHTRCFSRSCRWCLFLQIINPPVPSPPLLSAQSESAGCTPLRPNPPRHHHHCHYHSVAVCSRELVTASLVTLIIKWSFFFLLCYVHLQMDLTMTRSRWRHMKHLLGPACMPTYSTSRCSFFFTPFPFSLFTSVPNSLRLTRRPLLYCFAASC